MRIQLRHALPADRDVLESLIAASARGLGPGYYSTAQIEADRCLRCYRMAMVAL